MVAFCPSTFGFKFLVSGFLRFNLPLLQSLATLPKLHLFLWTKNMLVYQTNNCPQDRIWTTKLTSGEK